MRFATMIAMCNSHHTTQPLTHSKLLFHIKNVVCSRMAMTHGTHAELRIPHKWDTSDCNLSHYLQTESQISLMSRVLSVLTDHYVFVLIFMNDD